MAEDPTNARIIRARARLAANLGELQQRVTRVRNLVSPRAYLASPWLRLGLGVAAGYLIGRRHGRLRLPGAAPPSPAEPARPIASVARGLLHSAVRSVLISAAGALIERAASRILAAPAEDEDPHAT